MPQWTAALGLLLASSTLLAGCGSAPAQDPDGQVVTEVPLPEGKGGILGILVNDIYRPVPGGLIFVARQGLTATTDASGQFGFTGLDPGTYILQANALDHEASPLNVDVVAGEYTEVEFQSRRVFSEGGTIITTHYSVFIPCSKSDPVDGTRNIDCTADGSGDSFRIGFTSDYRSHGRNVTYLVTEMKANHKASSSSGALKVVVRDAEDADPYFANKYTADSDYLKLTMHLGNVSTDESTPAYPRNEAWNNKEELQTALFAQGQFKSETQAVLDAACPPLYDAGVFRDCDSRGVGVQVGVKANFVQSLFLGEPDKPIDSYAVYAPSP
jgi:hypothetical protein